MTDPYKVLGLSPDATDDQVKKAYRALAKKYHPDLNPGDKAAEQKMKEINDAYDRIKSGNVSGNNNGGYNNGGYQYGGYTSYGGFGNGGYYYYRTNNTQQKFETNELNAAYNYIRARHYKEALHVLSSIPNRNAAWYYLSAIANSGMGNRVTALEYAKKAVELEPDNDEYVNLADRLEYGGRAYESNSSRYAQGGGISCGSLCLGYICMRIFCC